MAHLWSAHSHELTSSSKLVEERLGVREVESARGRMLKCKI